MDSLIVVIQELEDTQFDNQNKETVIGVIQQETETYENKLSEFMTNNDAMILDAEDVLAGPNLIQQVQVAQES